MLSSIHPTAPQGRNQTARPSSGTRALRPICRDVQGDTEPAYGISVLASGQPADVAVVHLFPHLRRDMERVEKTLVELRGEHRGEGHIFRKLGKTVSMG